MTDSFKSTAATNIYDQAVNTYFNPVSVLPETGITGIARALKNNNPDLQRYLGNVIEEEKQFELESDKDNQLNYAIKLFQS